MNTRPLEVAMQVANLLKPLSADEQRAVLLILADLVKVITPDEHAEANGSADAPKPKRKRKPKAKEAAASTAIEGLPSDLLSYDEAASRAGVTYDAVRVKAAYGYLKKFQTPDGPRVSWAEVSAARFKKPRLKAAPS